MKPLLLISLFLGVMTCAADASLALYDAAIAADEGGAGPVPIAKLTSAVSLMAAIIAHLTSVRLRGP